MGIRLCIYSTGSARLNMRRAVEPPLDRTFPKAASQFAPDFDVHRRLATDLGHLPRETVEMSRMARGGPRFGVGNVALWSIETPIGSNGT